MIYTVEIQDPRIVDKLYSQDATLLVKDIYPYLSINGILATNDYLHIDCNNGQYGMGIVEGHEIYPINLVTRCNGITAKNLEQKALFTALKDEQVRMVAVYGAAGTGKTLCTMAWALDEIMNGRAYKKLVITKPRVQVTDDGQPMGELPGSEVEKMGPMIRSYEYAASKILGKGKAYWQTLMAQGDISIIPLEHMRGLDFQDSIVICDEAQNLGVNQTTTLVTRVAETSKLVVVGDQFQRDIQSSSHLKTITDHAWYKEDGLTTTIELLNVERSELVDLMIKISKDIALPS